MVTGVVFPIDPMHWHAVMRACLEDVFALVWKEYAGGHAEEGGGRCDESDVSVRPEPGGALSGRKLHNIEPNGL